MIVFRILTKFRRILSHHQKIRVLELTLLMLISGFLELLSVSMILPFTQAMVQPEEIMSNRYIAWFTGLMDIQTHRELMIFLAIAMAIVYIIKNFFLLFQMTVQNRYVYRQRFYTQQKLIRSYLLRPYEYYLDVSSGEILRVVSDDTTSAFNALVTLLNLFSESFVSFVLFIAVFVMSPLFSLSVGAILLLMVLLIQRLTQPIIRRAGERYQKTSAKMKQWLLQMVQGIKEIKIMHRESFFGQEYGREGEVNVKAQYINATLNVTPRFLIEAAMMSSLFIAVSIMISAGAEMKYMVPVLSAIAMAAVRLLPSMSRISSALGGLIYFEPTVDKMIENLRGMETFDNTYMEIVSSKERESDNYHIGRLSKNIILSDIIYKYPTGSDNILEKANMTIPRGSSVGIVGASGAGKTTAVDLLLGLLKPQSGRVMVDGMNIELDYENWISQIGYIPQSIFMLDGTIRENIAFGVSTEKIDDMRVWEVLKEASLEDFVNNLSEGLDTQIGERGIRLSGGQRQRIGIARALYRDPTILVFDEATSSLDNETETAIMESIDRMHGTKTLIIIAHRLTTIKNCDVVFRVENGKITKIK